MRKENRWIIVLLFLELLLMFTSAQAYGTQEENVRSEGFIQNIETDKESLPSSLLEIGDEAFEGTSLVQVRLPEKLELLGNRAFANILSLRSIYISSSVKEIGEEILADSGKVMVAGAANGAARRWAMENGYPFAQVAMITAQSGGQGASDFLEPFRKKLENESPGVERSVPDYTRERRTGRSVGELKAAHFKGRAAQHVQSRYFP